MILSDGVSRAGVLRMAGSGVRLADKLAPTTPASSGDCDVGGAEQ